MGCLLDNTISNFLDTLGQNPTSFPWNFRLWSHMSWILEVISKENTLSWVHACLGSFYQKQQYKLCGPCLQPNQNWPDSER